MAPFVRFLHVEASGGVVLLLCTIASLLLANSAWSDWWHHLWMTPVGIEFGEFQIRYSLEHWINDGLMALFFFVVGLEVKRELVLGELRDPRRAALPIAAAIGGMLVPAGIYLALQHGQPAERGWGIPMATDIAFVVGCMAILGKRVPHGLKVMLLTLAIADDIGAIVVIAVGYTSNVNGMALVWALVLSGIIQLLARLGVRSILVYTLLGVAVWAAFHQSGVHATLAGVVLGLLTPARSYLSNETFRRVLDEGIGFLQGDWELDPPAAVNVRKLQWAARETISPLEYLMDLLHPWVSFVVMPLFALANAGVHFTAADLGTGVAIAVACGLVLGKPIGILLFSWLAVVSGIGRLPQGVRWSQIVGGGCLAGIGFTMALFVANLALTGHPLELAKVGVLAGSTVSAVIGCVLLVLFSRKGARNSDVEAPAAQPPEPQHAASS